MNSNSTSPNVVVVNAGPSGCLKWLLIILLLVILAPIGGCLIIPLIGVAAVTTMDEDSSKTPAIKDDTSIKVSSQEEPETKPRSKNPITKENPSTSESSQIEAIKDAGPFGKNLAITNQITDEITYHYLLYSENYSKLPYVSKRAGLRLDWKKSQGQPSIVLCCPDSGFPANFGGKEYWVAKIRVSPLQAIEVQIRTWPNDPNYAEIETQCDEIVNQLVSEEANAIIIPSSIYLYTADAKSFTTFHLSPADKNNIKKLFRIWGYDMSASNPINGSKTIGSVAEQIVSLRLDFDRDFDSASCQSMMNVAKRKHGRINNAQKKKNLADLARQFQQEWKEFDALTKSGTNPSESIDKIKSRLERLRQLRHEIENFPE